MAAVYVPGGKDEVFEEGLLGWGVGVEFILVGGFEGVELGLFFRGADYGVGGGQAVLCGVFGGSGFAFGGARAGGLLGVELVGADLGCCGHLGAPLLGDFDGFEMRKAAAAGCLWFYGIQCSIVESRLLDWYLCKLLIDYALMDFE